MTLYNVSHSDSDHLQDLDLHCLQGSLSSESKRYHVMQIPFSGVFFSLLDNISLSTH